MAAVPYGALIATVGILSALAERDRTGRGALVDTSIVDSATWVLGEHVARVATGANAGWGSAPNRRAYRCADDRLITLAAAEPRTWAALCAALELPDLADKLWAAGDDLPEIADRLEEMFATRPAGEWVDLLGDHAAVGPVHRVEDLFDDADVQARGSVVTIGGDPDGARILRTPVRLVDADGTEAPFAPAPPPGVGRAHRRGAGRGGLHGRRDRRVPPRRRALNY